LPSHETTGKIECEIFLPVCQRRAQLSTKRSLTHGEMLHKPLILLNSAAASSLWLSISTLHYGPCENPTSRELYG
jgi:hypothetical protein